MAILDLDPAELIAIEDRDESKVRLELAKIQIIRSSIIMRYVLMDEFLNLVICNFYFGKKRAFKDLWRTKKFRNFNHFFLEKLYLLQKLEIVRDVARFTIPKKVVSDLSSLNELRNAVAHSFFPENRRRKPQWKGQDVFSVPGFEKFLDDTQEVIDFFMSRAF